MPNGSEHPVILVVEDEFLVRMLAVDIVREAGFTPVEAANADEAIALLEARSDIRLVLTDIDMPGSMDGIELLEIIRRRWPPVRVVVASGLGDRHRHQVPEDVRVFGKPYPFEEMIDHLHSLVSAGTGDDLH